MIYILLGAGRGSDYTPCHKRVVYVNPYPSS